jgi:hypothetical protein
MHEIDTVLFDKIDLPYFKPHTWTVSKTPSKHLVCVLKPGVVILGKGNKSNKKEQ